MKGLTHTWGMVCLVACYCFSVADLTAQNQPSVIALSNAPFCLGNTALQLDEQGAEGVNWTWEGPAGFTANIKNPVIQNPSLVNAGIYTVTVTGANGLTNVGTVEVNLLPPPPVNVSNAAICAGGTVQLQANGGLNCSWFPTIGLDNPLSCSPFAAPSSNTTYTLTATGANGCTSTAQATVAVHHPFPLSCKNLVTIALDEDGSVPITPGVVLSGSVLEDTFLKVTVLLQPNQQNLGNTVGCAQIGANLIVKVMDACSGNTCWGNLKVEDNLVPGISCQPLFLPCALPSYTPTYLGTQNIAFATPTATDNCGAPTLGYVDILHNLDCDAGPVNGFSDLSAYIERKWTAKDNHGNTSTCLQNIYLFRSHIPNLNLPADVTVSCSNPNVQPAVTGAPAVLFNGKKYPLFPGSSFCELNVVFTDQRNDICAGSYKILRTWTILDDCLSGSNTPPLNPLSYQQIIKVMDLAGPQMDCPANLTVNTDPYTCCVTLDLPDIILTDNCSRVQSIMATITSTDSTNGAPTYYFEVPGTLTDFPDNNIWLPDTLGQLGTTACLPVDTFLVQYVAKDGCENRSNCSFTLVVADLTPPIVICDKYTQVAISLGGRSSIPAINFDDGSYDQCCIKKFEARRTNGVCEGDPDNFDPTVDFCCVDVGKTIKVIVRVTDCAGNTDDCNINVEVVDKIPPVCIPPVNVTVSCGNFDPSLNAYGTATAQDNCCIGAVKSTVNYTAFDTVCNVGTIIRTFTAFDCGGLTSTCTQRIVVFYKQDFYIKMPSDANVTKCDGTGNFGVPVFLNVDCELIGLSYEDQIFTVVPDACYKIIRKWQIINWCTYVPDKPCIAVPNPEPSPNPLDPNNIRGPILSPPGTTGVWTPTVSSVTPGGPLTNYANLLDSSANCYTYDQYIKVIDLQDPKINLIPGYDQFCDLTPNDPGLWNAPYWWDAAIGSHNVCEGPAAPEITAIDSCTKADLFIKYLLYLDLDQDGVAETVINSAELPGTNTVNFGNAANPNFTGGQARRFDERNVPVSEQYAFALQTFVQGNLVHAAVKWNTIAQPNQYITPELPYGNHSIKWVVQDGCGNEAVKQYSFKVKDCKAPSPVCINGLSVNMMPTQMISIWASDLLQYAEDNCTPASALQLGIRKSDGSTTFPIDAAGNLIQEVRFTCAELGNQPVDLWVKDLAGNTAYCQTYVLVQDNMGNCPVVTGKAEGNLATEANLGLNNATVELSGVSTLIPAFSYFTTSDNTGEFIFHEVPFAADFSITPFKDDDPLNGVSTYDLALISRHILGIEPMSSPYQMIAADANKSGSITSFDIIEFRKLILGVYTALPVNTSWRFVDNDFVFPNLLNPFQSAFPEYRTTLNYQSDLNNANFIAVKVGDVNGNATANTLYASDERSLGTETLVLEDRALHSGETALIPVHANALLEGFQMTLIFKDLEVLEIVPGPSMAADQFAIFPAEQALTVSWFGQAIPDFSIRVRSLKSQRLRDCIAISNRITPSEAYTRITNGVLKHNLQLQFKDGIETFESGIGFELYQNQPNPFTDKTWIRFYLPESDEVNLIISDASGKIIQQRTGQFGKGMQSFLVDRQGLNTEGLCYYTLKTRFGTESKKMIYSGSTR
jgi:hypothetical protein